MSFYPTSSSCSIWRLLPSKLWNQSTVLSLYFLLSLQWLPCTLTATSQLQSGILGVRPGKVAHDPWHLGFDDLWWLCWNSYSDEIVDYALDNGLSFAGLECWLLYEVASQPFCLSGRCSHHLILPPCPGTTITLPQLATRLVVGEERGCICCCPLPLLVTWPWAQGGVRVRWQLFSLCRQLLGELGWGDRVMWPGPLANTHPGA